jgi:protein-disulfide isomerase
MNDPAIDDHIKVSMELSNALGFSGTPSFVVGNQLVPGLVETEKLLELVEVTRANE